LIKLYNTFHFISILILIYILDKITKKSYFTTGDYVGGLGKEALEELGTLTNLESL